MCRCRQHTTAQFLQILVVVTIQATTDSHAQAADVSLQEAMVGVHERTETDPQDRRRPYMCNIRNFNELCNQIYFVDKCEAINTVVQLKTSLRVVPPYRNNKTDGGQANYDSSCATIFKQQNLFRRQVRS